MKPTGFSTVEGVLGGFLSALRESGSGLRPLTGVPAGIPALDALTGGWQAGELVLVTGDGGAGKSALAYQVALAAARRADSPVALAPLKHTPETCIQRLLASLSGVDLARLRRGDIGPPERARLSEAASELESLPLKILHEPEPTLPDLLENVARLHRARGIRLLVVDGVHALAGEAGRQGGGAAAMDALRALAGRLAAPVLVTAGPQPPVEQPDAATRRLHLARESDSERAGIAVFQSPDPLPTTATLRFLAGPLRFASDAPAA